MRLTDIPKENRPRERLVKNGIHTLSNIELIALLLSKGSKDENILFLSQRILKQFTLEKLSIAHVSELKKIKGIGDVKAMQLLAAFELTRRMRQTNKKQYHIKSAHDVYTYFHPKIAHLDKEQFMVLHLNTRKKIIGEETISIGTLNASLIHPREIFKNAIKVGAHSIILAHNHPSGNPSPSKQDKRVTDILQEVGQIVGIHVIDHIIIGDKRFYSFAQQEVVECA